MTFPPSVRRLLLPVTTGQWTAIECINDLWMMAERGVSSEITQYRPSQRPTYRSVLAAAAWRNTHPNDPRFATLIGSETTIFMTLGDDLLHWNERGDGLWLPGIPGELPVQEDSHGPVPLDLFETPPFLTTSGLLWAGFDTEATRRREGIWLELRLWQDSTSLSTWK